MFNGVWSTGKSSISLIIICWILKFSVLREVVVRSFDWFLYGGWFHSGTSINNSLLTSHLTWFNRGISIRLPFQLLFCSIICNHWVLLLFLLKGYVGYFFFFFYWMLGNFWDITPSLSMNISILLITKSVLKFM